MGHVSLTAPTDATERDGDITALLARREFAGGFDLLVARYGVRIFRLCLGLLREPMLAEDTAQEALVRIWRALDRYDGRAALSTWIYAITRNRCLTAIERRRAGEWLTVGETLPDAPTPAPAIDDDRDGLLSELIGELPERYRTTLLIYYYQDRSIAETAEMLGVPQGTVKTNLHRARAELHARLTALGLGDARLWLENAP